MFTSFSLSDNTVGYIVHGDMDADGMRTMQNEILALIEEQGKINLYLEDANIEFFSLRTMIAGTRFPHVHHKSLNRVAMVTNRKWIHVLSSINGFLLQGNYKNFTVDQRLEAMSWVAGD